ncbi:hypothetical protein V6N13_082070 [Hibiscus sabdariffa]
MHLGGNFIETHSLKYVGGIVINWGIDPNVVSHGDICKIVDEAGYRGVKALYYLKPGSSLGDGLVLCWDNKSFVDLIGYWLVEREIHIYVEHDVVVPKVGKPPLSLPTPSVESDEGCNRDNTIDESKDVGESHVVGEGLNNINNGVGPSEVNSEQRVEANINEVDDGFSQTVERDQQAQRENEAHREHEAQKGQGVEKEQVDEDEDDPLEDVQWLGDNDDEELQEIHNHYKIF